MHHCNNTVGESYYSAHQAVSKFAEHHIHMVSWLRSSHMPDELVYLATLISRLNVSL